MFRNFWTEIKENHQLKAEEKLRELIAWAECEAVESVPMLDDIMDKINILRKATAGKVERAKKAAAATLDHYDTRSLGQWDLFGLATAQWGIQFNALVKRWITVRALHKRERTAEEKIGELMEWLDENRPVGDMRTVVAVQTAIDEARNRGGAQTIDDRQALRAYDNTPVEEWELMPMGVIVGQFNCFQQIAGDFATRNEFDEVKPSSVGEIRATEINLRADLIAKLYLRLVVESFKGVHSNVVTKEDVSLAEAVVMAVDELIEAIDKSNEVKEIVTLATDVIDSKKSKEADKISQATGCQDGPKERTPDLKLVGGDMICDRIRMIRYKVPENDADENSGRSIIEIQFYLLKDGERGGVKFIIEDKWKKDLDIMCGALVHDNMTWNVRKTLAKERDWTNTKEMTNPVSDIGDLKIWISTMRGKKTRFDTPTEVMEFDAP